MVKKLLFILGGIIALIVIAAVAAVMLIDVNSYKPKIETAAFDATDKKAVIVIGAPS